MVETGARGLRLRARPARARRSSPTYRKTHNDGVFDAYTAEMRAARTVAHHHRPARRLRPRPDHRRLPAGRALRRRPADRGQARRDEPRWTREPSHRGRHPRPRGTRRADPGAGRADGDGGDLRLRHLPARPTTAHEAVQWLYFGYLAAVKEQNGAAMSLGRTSTFLDVYLQRDLDEGRIDRDRRPGADRRLRDQAADRPVPAHPRVRRAVLRRPDLGDRVASAAWARTAGPLVTRTSLPLPADPLQPRPGPGTEPHRAVVAAPARRASRSSAPRCRSTPAPSSTSPTS